ncbi:FkbM family methyltransferase [Acinetobacter chinensis]|nr:FkbM family methyltransferase [Acinetobacter chinensis]
MMNKTAPMSLNQLKKPPSKPVAQATPPKAEVKLYHVENVQFLLFNGKDMISRQLRSGQLWDSPLIEIIKHFLTNIEKPVVLDIGANLGAITIPVGLYVQKKQGQVISFEAQRGVYYQLCGNIFSNQLIDTCTAYNIAIGNISGSIQVPVLDLAHEGNIGALSLDENIRRQQNLITSTISQFDSVSLQPIDSFNFTKIDLLKIDVEGLELEVLEGSIHTLKNCGFPPLFFEVWGDYMKELIPKRTELMNFVQQRLGYKTVMYGELCIAQHPDNQIFEISYSKAAGLSMTRLK